MAKTETTKTELPATVSAGLPAEFGEDLAIYAGAGVSDRVEDFQLPFIALAQGLSPQVDKQQPDKYIKGLEVGDIFNTATSAKWAGDTGLPVIPIFFHKAMVEWVPRNSGGGYVATHPIDTPLLRDARMVDLGDDKKVLRLPNGNDLIDTSYHFVVLAETGEVAVVSMTSSNLGTSRTWQTLMKNVKIPTKGGLMVAPCFSRVYRLRSSYKKKDNNSWYVFSVSDEGWSVPEYTDAFQLAKTQFVLFNEKGPPLGRPPVDGDGSAPVEGSSVGHSEDSPI